MDIKSDNTGRIKMPDFPDQAEIKMRDWAAKIIEKEN